jgi:hypothetical protein
MSIDFLFSYLMHLYVNIDMSILSSLNLYHIKEEDHMILKITKAMATSTNCNNEEMVTTMKTRTMR